MIKRILLAVTCIAAVSAYAAAQDSKAVAKGKALTVKNNCAMCHTLAGKGGKIAKPLDGVLDRMDAATIKKILADPVKEAPPSLAPNTPKMPKVAWAAGDIDAVVAYLETLKAAK